LTAARPDDFDLAATSGAVKTLRRRAAAIRKRASSGVTVIDGPPMTIVKTSEATHAFRVAADLDAIADRLAGTEKKVEP
jgi:hypothetical protein